MKDQVIVNGITLTRKQIEDAMKELDKPGLVAGDIVEFNVAGRGIPPEIHRCVVVGEGPVGRFCDKEYGSIEKLRGHVRIYDGRTTWAPKEEELKKV